MNEKWRRGVIVAAGVSVAISFPIFIIALSRLSGQTETWVKFEDVNLVLWVVVAPAFLATAFCVAMTLQLRSRTPKGIKKGLALAVSGAPLFIVSGLLSIPFTWGQAWVFIAGLFTLAQVVLLASAGKTYHSLQPEPGDAGLLWGPLLCSGPGWLWLFFVVLHVLPDLPRTAMVADEASAKATLRTLNTAELTYASSYSSGFTDTLAKLCSPESGQKADVNSADLADPISCGHSPGGTPTTFTRNGYVFTYVPEGKSAKIASYTIHADPVRRGSSGQSSFFTDESAIIRANATNPATASDNPI